MVKLVPLYKSGYAENLINYRPISILSCFLKIFEKLIHKHLISFFQNKWYWNANGCKRKPKEMKKKSNESERKQAEAK